MSPLRRPVDVMRRSRLHPKRFRRSHAYDLPQATAVTTHGAPAASSAAVVAVLSNSFSEVDMLAVGA